MKRPACTVGCCILFFLGLFFYLKPPEAASMAAISGKNIVIAGIVDDKYQRKESTYLTVKEAGIVSGMKSKKKYRVIVKLKEAKKSLAQAPKLGARVIVSGKGLEFSGARNPGNFDLSKYRMIRGIDFEIYGAEAYEASGGHRIRHMDETLCLIRERLSDTIDRIYGSEDGGTVKAMLLGDRSTLDDELQSGYRRGGMSHILCISGLHITLAGMAVLRLIKKTGINKAAAYLTTFSVISLYGRLTGFGISTMRALISFGLMMTAELLGRTADLLSVVAEAGIIIIFIQPLYVLDSGFVLSFSAVCGIGLLGPPLKRLIPLKGSLFESLRTSLAVTLFMLPEVMYFFYQVSLFSVLINLAVIPLLGILLMFSALSATAGCFWMPLGVFTGIPAKLILAVYKYLTILNDRLPFSVLTTGCPKPWQIALYYLILAVIVYYTDKKRETDRLMRTGCLMLTVFAVLILTVRIRPGISLTMIDVGQGDCHFLEAGGGKTVMIDCGSTDVDEVEKYRVIPYVLYRGYDTLDYAVLTHSDEDHVNGYIGMLKGADKEGLRIRTLILPDISQRDEGYMELVSLAGDKGVEIRTIKAGDRFKAGYLEFECLNPERDRIYPDANSSSVCLKVTMSGTSFRALYTGDVQGEGERIMTGLLSVRKSGRYTLLKCAHHGSKGSTPVKLLSLTEPAYTFISAGTDNPYSHPHRELIGRLEDIGTHIYTTSEKGAVRMDVIGKNVKVVNYVN